MNQYFQHDYPINDPKIICLLGDHGGLGYGLFWRIVEMLHEEKEHKLPRKVYIYEAIAKQMLANAEQIQTILNDCYEKYELFEYDDNFFWSKRVFENIAKREKIAEVRRIAGQAGAHAKQLLSKTPKSKVKESKVKESKDNSILRANAREEYSFNEQTKKMFSDTDKRMPIIAYYWSVKGFTFDNRPAYESALRRELRPAGLLVGYSNDKIKQTCEWLKANTDFKWTLETVHKYIDEPLENMSRGGKPITEDEIIKKIAQKYV